jgi:hypothetical protein
VRSRVHGIAAIAVDDANLTPIRLRCAREQKIEDCTGAEPLPKQL